MKKRTATKTAKTRIGQITHGKQSRPNIPTAEMQSLAGGEETPPVSVEYARNKDLDPQLVWKGKDAENAESLRVDAAPIYVQEKISPKAIIEDLRRRTAEMRPEKPGENVNLFADFNGLSEDARVQFYQHAQKWTNRMILGDSLMAMTSLANKEGMKGKVQCVYMDPPYGIKYSSNWQPSTKRITAKDGEESAEPEMIRAFRDTWKLGIHSYLSYLRDRLMVARDLLTESGSIFVQISNENVHLVRCLMDEIFGRDNFVSLIPFVKGSPLGTKLIDSRCDFIVFYAKEKQQIKYRQLFVNKQIGADSGYKFLEFPDGVRRRMTLEESINPKILSDVAKPFSLGGMLAAGQTPSCFYDFEFEGKIIVKKPKWSWTTNQTGMKRLILANRLWRSGKGDPAYVRHHHDFPLITLDNLWDDTWGASTKIYVVQTAEKVVQRCILMTTDPGDLVLDPTCGSGTTASVAEKFGRRWITMDSSRVALALARARLMGNSYDYYLLQDSAEGAKKEAELSGKFAAIKEQYAEDVRHGFVCKRAPHITLRAIANNKEIDEIHSRHLDKLESLRAKLNTATKNKFAEYEVPAEAADEWNAAAKKLHAEYVAARQMRQREIDESISQNADMETLVDRPYAAKNAVRVSGPFTMESLSPHRILPLDSADAETAAAQDTRPQSERKNETRFWNIVYENLKKSGVENTRKNQRLEFSELESWPNGQRIQFAGRQEGKGKEKRVAVYVGPEYGTVTRAQITAAAREAADMFDMLVVLGFAFEAHADENLMSIGRLQIWRARMNSSLQMGSRLATGKFGNLFIAFGEPDIDCRLREDGKCEVEIRGVDIFDPTTGAVKSSGVEDIACWMVDTDYNEESFFARHAYFCEVGKDPYNKLKRALKAEIDADAWATLYGSVSRPFPAPAGGKIAVKAINHYGDEVMKVFPTPAAATPAAKRN